MSPPLIWSSNPPRGDGVDDDTIHRREKRTCVGLDGRAVPGDGQNPEQWSAADKFSVVLEAAPLNNAELGSYCRSKGLLVEQLERWRTEVHTVLSASQVRLSEGERATDKKRIRDLEKDLRRKEKALAETAALLVLSRKYEALWTDGEDA